MEKVVLTGEAFQDDNPKNIDFIPERDQLYFVMQKGDDKFAMGMQDVLRCLFVAEYLGEVPEIPTSWWGLLEAQYDVIPKGMK